MTKRIKAKTLDKILDLLFEISKTRARNSFDPYYSKYYTVKKLAEVLKVDFAETFRHLKFLEYREYIGFIERTIHVGDSVPGDYILDITTPGIESHLYESSFVEIYKKERNQELLEKVKIVALIMNSIGILVLMFFTYLANENSKYFEKRDINQTIEIRKLQDSLAKQNKPINHFNKIDTLTIHE